MFESQITGECGGFFYMIRNLVSCGKSGLFANLKWRHMTFEDNELGGMWFYEPVWKTVVRHIRNHKIFQAALIAAFIGDCLIWASILHII